MDLYSRMIVGWAMHERVTRELAMGALRMAKFRRKPAPGLDRSRPVLQPRLSGAIGRIRHALLDKPQGKLLLQRADGKLLQQYEKRTGIP
jgi:transposase InsO family protein